MFTEPRIASCHVKQPFTDLSVRLTKQPYTYHFLHKVSVGVGCPCGQSNKELGVGATTLIDAGTSLAARTLYTPIMRGLQ